MDRAHRFLVIQFFNPTHTLDASTARASRSTSLSLDLADASPCAARLRRPAMSPSSLLHNTTVKVMECADLMYPSEQKPVMAPFSLMWGVKKVGRGNQCLVVTPDKVQCRYYTDSR
jgi:hypothetical protein